MPDRGRPGWVVGLSAVEGISALIALAMPITPSKTGSTWSPAEWFWADPSYLQDVAVYFVMTNALIFLFLLIVWIWTKASRSK